MPEVDPRLREAVAMALCWAEFADSIARRPADETPATYWAGLHPEDRQRYYADADRYALAMMGRAHKVVPVEPCAASLEAGSAVRGARLPATAAVIYRAMVAAVPRVTLPNDMEATDA